MPAEDDEPRVHAFALNFHELHSDETCGLCRQNVATVKTELKVDDEPMDVFDHGRFVCDDCVPVVKVGFIAALCSVADITICDSNRNNNNP